MVSDMQLHFHLLHQWVTEDLSFSRTTCNIHHHTENTSRWCGTAAVKSAVSHLSCLATPRIRLKKKKKLLMPPLFVQSLNLLLLQLQAEGDSRTNRKCLLVFGSSILKLKPSVFYFEKTERSFPAETFLSLNRALNPAADFLLHDDSSWSWFTVRGGGG